MLKIVCAERSVESYYYYRYRFVVEVKDWMIFTPTRDQRASFILNMLITELQKPFRIDDLSHVYIASFLFDGYRKRRHYFLSVLGYLLLIIKK